MHPILLAAMRDLTLGDAAKTVLSYLYGRTNGTLSGTVFVDEICDDLAIAESTLRRRRAELAAYLRSDRSGDLLAFTIIECADFAHSERAESAHPESQCADSAQSERADFAHSAPERAESARAESAQCVPQRAESAHSAKRAERENRHVAPHTPLQGIVNNTAGAGSTSTSSNTSRAQGLLTAVGVWPDTAAELARSHSLEAIARHVADWQIAKATKSLGVPALVHRIRQGSPPVVAAADLTAGLLADHVTDRDLVQWRLKTDPLAAYETKAPAGMKLVHGILRPDWWTEDDDEPADP